MMKKFTDRLKNSNPPASNVPEPRGYDAKALAEQKAVDAVGEKWRKAAEASGEKPVEVGGPKGLEPTRYGDWERAGRCVISNGLDRNEFGGTSPADIQIPKMKLIGSFGFDEVFNHSGLPQALKYTQVTKLFSAILRKIRRIILPERSLR